MDNALLAARSADRLEHPEDYSLEEVRRRIEQDLAEGDQRLPFRVEGRVFHQVIQQSSGRYQIVWSIPAGWTRPNVRTVVIHSQTPGVWFATDRLTGQSLGTLVNGLRLTEPVGELRLIVVQSPAL